MFVETILKLLRRGFDPHHLHVIRQLRLTSRLSAVLSFKVRLLSTFGLISGVTLDFDWQIVWIVENIKAITGNEYQMKAAA